MAKKRTEPEGSVRFLVRLLSPVSRHKENGRPLQGENTGTGSRASRDITTRTAGKEKTLRGKNRANARNIVIDIARREGITRARVTQVMGMLRLPSEIREKILAMPDGIHRP
ncbi:MAG: hypothetical protein ACXW4G_04930 [Candidatus Deferrimicrobiaceae bacterium]